MMTPRALLDERHIEVTGGWVTVFHAGPLSGEYTGSSDEYLAPGVGLPGHTCADRPPERCRALRSAAVLTISSGSLFLTIGDNGFTVRKTASR